MIITITVDDDKVLQALNKAWKKIGRPDALEDPNSLDEQDIAEYALKELEVEASDIEIDRV